MGGLRKIKSFCGALIVLPLALLVLVVVLAILFAWALSLSVAGLLSLLVLILIRPILQQLDIANIHFSMLNSTASLDMESTIARVITSTWSDYFATVKLAWQSLAECVKELSLTQEYEG